ncbi:MAG: hypothetical protein AB2421_14405 [Thermotaleaceae bacterium]
MNNTKSLEQAVSICKMLEDIVNKSSEDISPEDLTKLDEILDMIAS